MTLPLIYALNNCSAKREKLGNQFREKIITKIKTGKRSYSICKRQKGLTYAEGKMIQFQQEALHLIEDFPSSPYKASLTLMVNYVIERKKNKISCF